MKQNETNNRMEPNGTQNERKDRMEGNKRGKKNQNTIKRANKRKGVNRNQKLRRPIQGPVVPGRSRGGFCEAAAGVQG